MNVLIVDDSPISKIMLNKALKRIDEKISIEELQNGFNIYERLGRKKFDAVLIDTSSKINAAAYEQLIKLYPNLLVIPMGINYGKRFDSNFLIKPTNDDFDVNIQIVYERLKNILQSKIYRPLARQNSIDIVLIASSTGGPQALKTVFASLSEKFTTPILVVQHMPPGFTGILAENLSKLSFLKVAEGKDGDVILGKRAFVAQGGTHMVVSKGSILGNTVKLKDGELVNGVKPSADVLFDSVSDVYSGKNILAVVLTGMGADGTFGVSKLKEKCKCYCIAQSEESCTIYGMPRSVIEHGFCDEIVHLENIAERIEQICSMK